MQDPKGILSLVARTDPFRDGGAATDFLLRSFSSEPFVLELARTFCRNPDASAVANIDVGKGGLAGFARAALARCVADDAPDRAGAYLLLHRLVRLALAAPVSPLAAANLALLAAAGSTRRRRHSEAVLVEQQQQQQRQRKQQDARLPPTADAAALDPLFVETCVVRLRALFDWLAAGADTGRAPDPTRASADGTGMLLLAPPVAPQAAPEAEASAEAFRIACSALDAGNTAGVTGSGQVNGGEAAERGRLLAGAAMQLGWSMPDDLGFMG
ncbi:hypothetical protein HK405_013479 [Cladochytrium tenue]|nr:hypothetical protein HK405_013479 [Cladochytrium tenue]